MICLPLQKMMKQRIKAGNMLQNNTEQDRGKITLDTPPERYKL